eukprot:GHVQ01015157.1.p1 GENE.GHVQ01015157.1~~GHVQ01015157.1.p1  ORF type:complete len:242 (+),score=26.75 GHVQ01015157.1:166-891(+)
MSSSRGSQSLYDRHITIFSPDGHLYQVEYAFRAVKSCNMTAIAVKGKDTVVIVSQKKMPTQQLQQDKLLDPSCVTSVYNVTDEIGTVMLGRPADCRGIVYRSRSEAADFAEKKGYNIPVHWLAQRVADINQVYTQHAYMRPPACAGLFIAVDDEKGPSIYKFDPAGWFAGYKVTLVPHTCPLPSTNPELHIIYTCHCIPLALILSFSNCVCHATSDFICKYPLMYSRLHSFLFVVICCCWL